MPHPGRVLKPDLERAFVGRVRRRTLNRPGRHRRRSMRAMWSQLEPGPIRKSSRRPRVEWFLVRVAIPHYFQAMTDAVAEAGPEFAWLR